MDVRVYLLIIHIPIYLKAKKFVESLPKVLKDNLPKEDAEKMKTTFEALGAQVKLD